MDYIQAVLMGFATVDEIDDYIEKWHEEDDYDCELSEYLGMTKDEYEDWFRNPSYIYEILLRREKLIDDINKYRNKPSLFLEEFLGIKLLSYQKTMVDSWW